MESALARDDVQTRHAATAGRGRPGPRASAGTHRRHHGRQRPLGAAARPAARRGPRPRRRQCAHRRRGVLPSGRRAADALLSQQRKLEAAQDGARFPDGTAGEVPRRGAARDPGPEHSLQRHRPPRRLAGAGAAADRRERPPQPGQHRHGPVPGHQLRRPHRADRRRAASLARQVRDGRLDPDAIDEAAISGALYTAGTPDPDLLIRTAGEMRISNFLLWQISYAELWVTPVAGRISTVRRCTRPCATTPRANGASAG